MLGRRRNWKREFLKRKRRRKKKVELLLLRLKRRNLPNLKRKNALKRKNVRLKRNVSARSKKRKSDRLN